MKVQKFYQAGGQTVAVRTLEGEQDTLHWILADHLGSTSVTANADGSWNSQIQYTAFGEIRSKSGVTPSDYRYTGQLSEPAIGLYFYVSRFYDPEINQFNQPDSLIPDSYNSLDWNRYLYARGNPIVYIDPNGHKACSEGDTFDTCADMLAISNKDLYDQLVNKAIFKLPSIDEVANPNKLSRSTVEATIAAYNMIRKKLFLESGLRFIDQSGKIKDEALTAIIIAGEFGAFRYNEPEVYGEALEAVSNQYHSNKLNPGNALCYGSCSQESQVSWLTLVESARKPPIVSNIFRTELWLIVYDDAVLATRPEGYTYGANDTSWMWGNVNDVSQYVVTAQTNNSAYPGYGLFIVHGGLR